MNGIFTRILVAMSGTESSEAAAAMALRLAKLHGAEVVMVNVMDTSLAREIARVLGRPEDEVLSEMARSAQAVLHHCDMMARREGVAVDTTVRKGVPYLEVVAEAQERGADLIVLGSTHVDGMRRAALGRVVERVIEHSACPVLVVRRSAQSARS